MVCKGLAGTLLYVGFYRFHLETFLTVSQSINFEEK